MPTSIPPFNNVPAPTDPVQSAWAAQLTQYTVDHVNDTVDAHDASAISFVPTGSIAATTVQAAIAEIAGEGLQAGTPAGGVLAGTYPNPSFSADMATQAELDAAAALLQTGITNNGVALNAHMDDTVDAHDASAISFTPTGTIQATNVQAALAEVAVEAGGGSGGLTLVGATTEPLPAANNIIFFGKKIGNAVLAMMRSPLSTRRAIMPLGGWHYAGFMPSMTVTADPDAWFGTGANNVITQTYPDNTNRFTRAQRHELLKTPAATNNVADWIMGSSMAWMGSSGEGGFVYSLRWGPATGVSNTNMRAFAGLGGTVGVDNQPSTLTNILGMGWDSADTNVQLMTNDGSGSATKVDLGLPVPTVDRTNMYELILICPAIAGEVNWLVTDLITGTEVQGVATTNIPAPTSVLRGHAYMSVGGTSAVVGIAMFGADLWVPF